MPTPRRFAGVSSILAIAATVAVAAVALVALAQDAPPTPGPAKTPVPAAMASREKEGRERDADAPKGEDPLARELDALLRGAGRPAEFWIDVTWPTATNQLTSARVWGNGVGIWNRAAQFRLSKEEVKTILRQIRESRFGAYPLEVHEEEKEGAAKKPGEREETELYGRIIVNAGDVTHLVRQTGDRPERELDELAKTVIRICEKPAAQGQRVASLDDGLRRVSDGKLAPEAFEVLARRKVDKPDPGPGVENWMLRINGRRALDRDLTKKPAVERVLRLTDQEMKTIASLLRDAKAGTLPQSLWAPLYTTLRVQVLNQARNIQARQFVGMTPEAHGEQQKAFDKVFAWCVKTHERVRANGRVLPAQKWEREGEREREGEKERD